MKRVFISQPMRNKSEAEILNERDQAIAELEERFGEPVDIVDSYNPKLAYQHPLASLGYSIQLMSKADTAYFCEGWEEARGCKIEHECAVQYGLEVIEK